MQVHKLETRTFLSHFGVPGSAATQDAVARAVAAWITEDSLGSATVIEEVYYPPPGTMGMMFARANIYFNVGGICREQFTVLVAGLATLATSGDLTTAAITALAAEATALWRKIGRLNEDQLEAARRLVRLMDDQSIYEGRVTVDRYVQNWPAGEEEKAVRLLSELHELGVVRDAIDGWTFVR